jgi:hypothetical protein
MEIVSLIEPGSRDYEGPFRSVASSAAAYEARVGGMMLDLLDAVRRDSIGPRLFAFAHTNRELWLQYYSASNGASAMIRITIDRPDYGPLEDGLPRFHYRLDYRIKSSNGAIARPLIEQRAHSVETACAFVREAISDARALP